MTISLIASPEDSKEVLLLKPIDTLKIKEKEDKPSVSVLIDALIQVESRGNKHSRIDEVLQIKYSLLLRKGCAKTPLG